MHVWTQETSATVVRVSVARGTENSKLSPLNFWKNPREVIRRSQLKALSPLKPTLQGVHRQAEGHRLQHAAAEPWADGQSVTRRTTLFRREVLHHRFGLDVPVHGRVRDCQALWKHGAAIDGSGCAYSV